MRRFYELYFLWLFFPFMRKVMAPLNILLSFVMLFVSTVLGLVGWLLLVKKKVFLGNIFQA